MLLGERTQRIERSALAGDVTASDGLVDSMSDIEDRLIEDRLIEARNERIRADKPFQLASAKYYAVAEEITEAIMADAGIPPTELGRTMAPAQRRLWGQKKRADAAMHRLWTQVVGTPGYVKTDWMEL